MKKLAFCFLLAFGSVACSKENAKPATPTAQASADGKGDNINCPDVYAPVCSNGITYPNACYAGKAGATTYTKGACNGEGGPI